MEQNELQRALMAILFAAGEPVAASRLSESLAVDEAQIHEELKYLMDLLSFHRSGIRIVRLEDAYQMCSAAEQAELVTKTLETRKPPKLSSSQLETLSVIAYYQPATKAYVEQIRGVDSGYSISALLTKKLIREAGRLNVPEDRFSMRRRLIFCGCSAAVAWPILPPIEKVELSTNQATAGCCRWKARQGKTGRRRRRNERMGSFRHCACGFCADRVYSGRCGRKLPGERAGAAAQNRAVQAAGFARKGKKEEAQAEGEKACGK